jgi:mannose/fructose/sorbose-specific phosphotransferase system IIA component
MRLQTINSSPSIVILTHGRAGEELLKSAELIAGPIEDAIAISLLEGQSPEDYCGKVESVLKTVNEGSMVFVDLYGGTPSNAIASLLDRYKVGVVSGLNLPMVLEQWSRRAKTEYCRTGICFGPLLVGMCLAILRTTISGFRLDPFVQ